ncbi:hypothetical protein ACU8KH_06522 [Lachancea thermotolerans]
MTSCLTDNETSWYLFNAFYNRNYGADFPLHSFLGRLAKRFLVLSRLLLNF